VTNSEDGKARDLLPLGREERSSVPDSLVATLLLVEHEDVQELPIPVDWVVLRGRSKLDPDRDGRSIPCCPQSAAIQVCAVSVQHVVTHQMDGEAGPALNRLRSRACCANVSP